MCVHYYAKGWHWFYIEIADKKSKLARGITYKRLAGDSTPFPCKIPLCPKPHRQVAPGNTSRQTIRVNISVYVKFTRVQIHMVWYTFNNNKNNKLKKKIHSSVKQFIKLFEKTKKKKLPDDTYLLYNYYSKISVNSLLKYGNVNQLFSIKKIITIDFKFNYTTQY